MKWIARLSLIGAVLLTAAYSGSRTSYIAETRRDWLAQESPAQPTKELPQVVLKYDHTEPNGTVVVEPQGRVGLGLTPMQSIAPLPPGSLMICRPHQTKVGVMQGEKMQTVYDIGFRCGQDEYVFQALAIQEKR